MGKVKKVTSEFSGEFFLSKSFLKIHSLDILLKFWWGKIKENKIGHIFEMQNSMLLFMTIVSRSML